MVTTEPSAIRAYRHAARVQEPPLQHGDLLLAQKVLDTTHAAHAGSVGPSLQQAQLALAGVPLAHAVQLSSQARVLFVKGAPHPEQLISQSRLLSDLPLAHLLQEGS